MSDLDRPSASLLHRLQLMSAERLLSVEPMPISAAVLLCHQAAARIGQLQAYEKMADQITAACTRWGWEHCTGGQDLVEQIDKVLSENKQLEAEVTYYKKEAIDED